MKRTSITISFIVLLTIGGCEWFKENTKPKNLPEQWTKLGLSNVVVNKIHLTDQYIYTATDEGIYQKRISDADTTWTPRGLAGQRVLDFVFLNPNEIIACVDANQPGIHTSIYRTTNGGENWAPYQNGFGGDTEFTTCHAITKDPSNPNTLYARAAIAVAKSTDRGQSWQLVYNQWNATGYQAPLIKVHPTYPNIVWAGGESTIFQPYLHKSVDYGQSWPTANIPYNGDNCVYSLVNHPTDTSQVLVGMEGQILHTTDGGNTWTAVWQPDKYPYILAMKWNLNRDRIYATGSLNGTAGGELFFYKTDDFGRTWQTLTYSQGSGTFSANDLDIRNAGSRAGLYFGTNRGVYWYSGF